MKRMHMKIQYKMHIEMHKTYASEDSIKMHMKMQET